METDDPRRSRPDGTAADLAALARDWITLWQSELTAAAADRELQEGWQTMAALWAAAATAMVQAWPRGGAGDRSAGDGSAGDRSAGDGSAGDRSAGDGNGWAGTGVPPRPAPAAAAPDPRDAEIERLGRRIDALECRLAALDGSGSVPGGDGA